MRAVAVRLREVRVQAVFGKVRHVGDVETQLTQPRRTDQHQQRRYGFHACAQVAKSFAKDIRARQRVGNLRHRAEYSGAQTPSNALSRSAIKSSRSSIPAEMRTRPGVMPRRLRVSMGTDAWVMVSGCEIRVSTPPRDSAREQSFTRSRNFFALSYE